MNTQHANLYSFTQLFTLRFMRWIFSLLALVLCAACSCGSKSRIVRIGVDPTWSPVNFGPMQPYVNGYIDDLLLEIARYSGLKFEKVHANADTLLEGLRTGQYEAVLAALPPYTFNEAKYDFSDHFLTLGPVLITAKGSSIQKLEKIPEDNLVGVLQGDPAALFVQKQPGLILRYYSSTPELLDAVSSGTVTAALLDRIKACAYVSDLYQTTLQVSSSPLNNEGLHFLQPKGKDASFFRLFEKSLKALEEKQDALQKKWKLA